MVFLPLWIVRSLDEYQMVNVIGYVYFIFHSFYLILSIYSFCFIHFISLKRYFEMIQENQSMAKKKKYSCKDIAKISPPVTHIALQLHVKAYNNY